MLSAPPQRGLRPTSVIQINWIWKSSLFVQTISFDFRFLDVAASNKTSVVEEMRVLCMPCYDRRLCPSCSDTAPFPLGWVSGLQEPAWAISHWPLFFYKIAYIRHTEPLQEVLVDLISINKREPLSVWKILNCACAASISINKDGCLFVGVSVSKILWINPSF